MIKPMPETGAICLRSGVNKNEMAVTTTISATSPASAVAGKYLTVRLGCDQFGIAIGQVREIVRLSQITPVPRMAPHIRGIINLRGRLVPLVDLRLRLGLDATELGDRTCVVVVQLSGPDEANNLFGLLADAVGEVATVASAECEPTPWFGPDTPTEHMTGLTRKDGTVCVLLNLESALSESASNLEPLERL